MCRNSTGPIAIATQYLLGILIVRAIDPARLFSQPPAFALREYHRPTFFDFASPNLTKPRSSVYHSPAIGCA
ncbi:hypothetical protein QT970_18410 [Microcoleus sp. herbarium8]|uniref:hypothetical protein n=1 Tax=Microcoleus sp. herbarium8 TaxID=3055436 RepID=UPI002FD15646